jgi:RNA polymerase sigma-70 factor (ECF subfamily)
MSISPTMTGDFHVDLKTLLPRLRVYALSLTHDRDRADDLVQETVVKSLAGRHSFRPGTNFAAWLFRIQRNEFISGIRRQRQTVPLDDAIANKLSHPPTQESRLIMREFTAAFRHLAGCQREALLLSVLEGWSYQEIAELAGVSVGTIKSRVSRGRATLKRILTGDDRAERDMAERDMGVDGALDVAIDDADIRPIGGFAVASAIAA